ncbi:hypothetical protein ACIBEJ_00620 [Nonomuraea sp. NPDC050790]|uniref:hypothetical protein n=1 Tax=Nonomuraea sp. NPDC050790 TaxID=3364371 RepID=UPI00378EB085
MAEGSPYERWKEIESVEEFDLLPEHVTLLRRAHFEWGGHRWVGGPALHSKRPFGNHGGGEPYSDVNVDMAAILDGRTDGAYEEDREERYTQLLGELPLALEIVLQSGSFEPGRYLRPRGGDTWQRSSPPR